MEESEKIEILETYRWITVKKFTEDSTLSYEERYKLLWEHHIEETTFLIEKLRNIVRELKS